MATISYQDKVAINVNPGVADINKVKAEDMNEIKNVVNGNYNEVGDITNLTTTNKTSVVNAINEVNDKNNYTSTEQEVGTWLSKKLYRIVITSTTKNFTTGTHTIGTLDASYTMVMVDILFHNTGNSNEYLIGSTASDFQHDSNSLKVVLSANWGTGYMEAVVYYTKN